MNLIQNKARALSKHPHFTNFMYIPAVLLFTVFIVYPFLEGIRIAFTNWNGFSQSYDYVGFKNFIYLIQDKNMYTASWNTMIYGFGSTLFQQILGLLYALLLNKMIFGRNFARTFIYLPVLIAPVIMGYMWYFMFQYRYGALNDVLALVGMDPLDWLAKGRRAISLIVFVNTVQFCGVSMVIYLAGLQTIPTMYYEASQIDGASPVKQFKHITMPLLRPAFITSVTLNLIGGLKLFDAIKAMTNGGPGYASHSLSTLIDYTYFRSQSAGYSATMGILLFVMILVFTLIIQKLSARQEVIL
ncbi:MULTISPECIES: carbohydrate ABC transporter permease [unclassified Oceanispirochaeta]|uniref:carbohydrate ABC transporter permease n=1 Tax=unclassified Oceanispirochaeta TaxID=2635722 RepID=UPI0018F37DDF|nr:MULTISPECIES: sugar ABC transporter permease [unclassified Oceanispirochaeta]